MARTQISPETIESIKDLHAAGLSARKIASNLGISASTVSKYCKRLGLKFEREQTIQANQARRIDLEAERLRLAERMIHEAHAALDILSGPVMDHHWHEDKMHSAVIPSAPIGDRRVALTAAAITGSSPLTRGAHFLICNSIPLRADSHSLSSFPLCWNFSCGIGKRLTTLSANWWCGAILVAA